MASQGTEFGRLIEALKAAGLNYQSHRSVADLLHLLQHWDVFTGSGSRAQEPEKAAGPDPQRQGGQPQDNSNEGQQQSDSSGEKEEEGGKSRNQDESPSIFLDEHGQGGEGAPAARTSVSDPAALPNALLVARALRPLARRLASKREVELDEKQTAEQSAHWRHLAPVFRPVRERWFEVLLLVEDTVAMAVWQRAIGEFAVLLGTHGAFRDVRRAKFRVVDSRVEVIEQSGRLTGPGSIVDPEGRRLVLLFTHGVARDWAGGVLHREIMGWAARQPVAIVQMLPHEKWEHTELGETNATVRAQRPGTPNTAWTTERSAWQKALHPDGTAIPVFTLHDRDVARWARMLMAEEATTMPAYFLGPAVQPRSAPNPPAASELSAAARVARFKANASAQAWRLAVALAGSPLQLPVMRLVQQTIFRRDEIEQSHLAELLLGGLMERIYKTDDPERDGFEFQSGVREILAESLSTRERYAVRGRVYDYIRQHRDTMQVFPALVPDKNGTARLPAWQAPFASEDGEELLQFEAPDPDAPVRRMSAAITALAYLDSGDLVVGLADGFVQNGGKWSNGAGAVRDLQSNGTNVAVVWSSGQYDGPGVPPPGLERVAWLGDDIAFTRAEELHMDGRVYKMADRITCAAPLSVTCVALGLENGQVWLVHAHGVMSLIAGIGARCMSIACREGDTVAVGGSNGELQIWREYPHGPSVTTLRLGAAVLALAWAPDGRLACGVSSDVSVWESGLDKSFAVGSHSADVTALAWSGDARLTSGSADRTVRMWRFERRASIAFGGEDEKLLQALIARGHKVTRDVGLDCRTIVWPEGLPLFDAGNEWCLPVVHYTASDSFSSVFERIDAALDLPSPGRLFGVREVDPHYLGLLESETQLREHILSGRKLIALVGERRIGKTDIICRVVRECAVRHRFPGGIFRKRQPDRVGDGPLARIDLMSNFSPDWELREGDAVILEGTQREFLKHLVGHSVAAIGVESEEYQESKVRERLAQLCACRSARLPFYVSRVMGSAPDADERLRRRGLITLAEDGSVVAIDARKHATYHGHASPSLHRRIAEALAANATDAFSYQERLYHLNRSGQTESAVALAEDANWLIPALEAGESGVIEDLRTLGLAELADDIQHSDQPLRVRLAESGSITLARGALRYRSAAKLVVVVGTGAHNLNPSELNSARAVGRAVANAGFGLITGAWPGVDYVTAEAYLANGGKALTHVLTGYSPDRFAGAMQIQANDPNRSITISDAVVLIGGAGTTIDVFNFCVSQNKPVFPYGPSGGDALAALSRMRLNADHLLRSSPSPDEFARYVIEGLKGDTQAEGTGTRMLELATEYERTRAALPSGSERTGLMTDIFERMLAEASNSEGLLEGLVTSPSPGRRLAAIAILQERPNGRYLDWLAGRLDNPEIEKPFIGYHAARALLQAVEFLTPGNCERLAEVLAKARGLADKLPSDPDRIRVLQMAEHQLAARCGLDERERDVTRLVRQELHSLGLHDAFLTRNLLIFETPRQRTWISFTTAGVFCTLDNRPRGDDYFQIQWFQRLHEIDAASVSTRDRNSRSGLLRIGARSSWLYSQPLFRASGLKETVLRELARAAELSKAKDN